MGKKIKREKTPDGSSKKGPVPPARLLQLVSEFLTEHSCVKAHRALQKAINDNGWDTDSSYGDQSLTSIFRTWETAQNGAVASVDDPASASSSDSDADSSESESDSSNKGSKVAPKADLVAAGTKSLKRKASRNSNSATSTSVPDSSSEAEPTSKKRKTADAAQSSESSESNSDAGSSETSTDGSGSGSDEPSSDSDDSDDSDGGSDDSGSNSEQAGRTGANVAESSSEEEASSEDGSSDSDSDSGGEIAAKAAAGIPIPESDSDDTSDDSSSDSELEDEKKGSAAVSRVSSDSSVTLGRQSPVSRVKQDAPPLPPDPVMKGPKKQNDPFSRIPKNIKVDPKFASNNYISVGYSQQAHEDLIVTKGKGFTKEKNKKKKGSFRGGPIDISHSGSIYFDD